MARIVNILKSKYSMRAFAFALACVFFVSFSLSFQRANAVATEAATIFLADAVVSYAEVSGLALSADVASSVVVSEAVASGAIASYAAAEGTTVAALGTTVAAGTVVSVGTIAIAASAAAILAGIVYYIVNSYNLTDTDDTAVIFTQKAFNINDNIIYALDSSDVTFDFYAGDGLCYISAPYLPTSLVDVSSFILPLKNPHLYNSFWASAVHYSGSFSLPSGYTPLLIYSIPNTIEYGCVPAIRFSDLQTGAISRLQLHFYYRIYSNDVWGSWIRYSDYGVSNISFNCSGYFVNDSFSSDSSFSNSFLGSLSSYYAYFLKYQTTNNNVDVLNLVFPLSCDYASSLYPAVVHFGIVPSYNLLGSRFSGSQSGINSIEYTRTSSYALPEDVDGVILDTAPGVILNPSDTLDLVLKPVVDAIVAGDPSVSIRENSPPIVPPVDWDNPSIPSAGNPSDPDTNVDMTLPYLPNIYVPWHYVIEALDIAAKGIALIVVTFDTAIPNGLKVFVWAAVVISIIFGFISRLLE